jgi:Asp-tRNA(Asn)/Glu-tRNA(Gln) amidotransferase A subunit family amidase
MVPIATGSDMGGSLRNPAAYCGVVGFRPSPGVVPYPERVPLLSPLTVLGPMARSVADVRLLLSAMAPGQRLASGGGPAFGIGLPDVRAAFSADLGTAPIAMDIRATFEARFGRIRGLFGSAGWDHPDSDGAHAAFDVLRGVDFLARDLSAYRADPGAISPLMKANVESALRLTAADVAAAHVAQTSLASRWRTFFGRWDILITPSMALSPGPWSELAPSSVDGVGMASYFHWLALAYIPTLVGHPAVSIPAGRDGAGMPFGLQLVGRPGGDHALLAIAEQVERAMSGDSDTSRPLPDLDALAAAPPLSGSPFFMGYGEPVRPGPER